MKPTCLAFERPCWNISEHSLFLLRSVVTQDHFASHAAVKLGLSMFPLFALALNLPEDFFADKVLIGYTGGLQMLMKDFQTLHPAAVMRLLHYPPQTGEIDERIIGIGAHTE